MVVSDGVDNEQLDLLVSVTHLCFSHCCRRCRCRCRYHW